MRDEIFEAVRDKECSKEMYVDNYDKAQDNNMKQVAMKYSAAKHLLRLSPHFYKYEKYKSTMVFLFGSIKNSCI